MLKIIYILRVQQFIFYIPPEVGEIAEKLLFGSNFEENSVDHIVTIILN